MFGHAAKGCDREIYSVLESNGGADTERCRDHIHLGSDTEAFIDPDDSVVRIGVVPAEDQASKTGVLKLQCVTEASTEREGGISGRIEENRVTGSVHIAATTETQVVAIAAGHIQRLAGGHAQSAHLDGVEGVGANAVHVDEGCAVAPQHRDIVAKNDGSLGGGPVAAQIKHAPLQDDVSRAQRRHRGRPSRADEAKGALVHIHAA